MARAGVRQRLRAVEDLAAGVEQQAGVGVLGHVRDADLDAADLVDHRREPGEVDLDVVVDRDAQRLGHGLRQPLRALVVGGVDLGRAIGAGDVDPQVARQAQQRRPAVAFAAQDHDRVAAGADGVIGVADGPGVGIVGVDAFARVGADEEVVLGRHVVGRLLEDLLHALDAGDVVGAVLRRHEHAGAARHPDEHGETERQCPRWATEPATRHGRSGYRRVTADPGHPARPSECFLPPSVCCGASARHSDGRTPDRDRSAASERSR